MKANFYTALLLFLSVNSYCQEVAEATRIDSMYQQKFVLSSKNDVAESGRYKRLQVFVNFDKEQKAYSVSAWSEREINCILGIKDQDDNIIFFKQVTLYPGNNTIPLVVEDGMQTLFSLYLQGNRDEDTAVYVFRFVKEITYSRR